MKGFWSCKISDNFVTKPIYAQIRTVCMLPAIKHDLDIHDCVQCFERYTCMFATEAWPCKGEKKHKCIKNVRVFLGQVRSVEIL